LDIFNGGCSYWSSNAGSGKNRLPADLFLEDELTDRQNDNGRQTPDEEVERFFVD
jgi:hypothetical protein